VPALDGPARFNWLDGERLIRFGDGLVAEAAELLASGGFRAYSLLTTERAIAEAPALGGQAAAVVRVPPGAVPEAAAAIRSRVAGRPLVAFGGGRVIDVAKAIAAADGLHCAAVPTTLSGAELTQIHRMPAGAGGSGRVRPRLVIADPRVMASQPMPLLAASAMNALGHAVEALYTPLANPVATLAALRAASLIASGLRADEPARADLALGALLGGYATGSTGYAVHHVLCQTLVGVAGTPHAETNAVLLPHSLRLMQNRAPVALERLASALAGGELERGLAPAGGRSAADNVAKLASRAQVTCISDLGVARALLDEVAARAVARPELQHTPLPPDQDELAALLEAAY